MTPKELIDNANALGAQVSTEHENQIGVQFKTKRYSGLWHWFDIWCNDEVYFNHSYSQNTGKSFKGVRHGLKIKERLGFYKNMI